MRNVMLTLLRLGDFVQIPRNAVYCWLKGVNHDISWRFHGLPFIRRGGRGIIKIGKYFVANSKLSRNSFGIIQRVMIRTVRPTARIIIGDYVGVSGCTISAANSITIGNHVLIGSGVAIVDQDAHPVDPFDRHDDVGEVKTAPVVIEDDVFIGARSIILKGVTIGRGSVIGAGSVVPKSIPPFSIAVGNPAKVVGDSRKNLNRKSPQYETEKVVNI